MLLYIVSSEPSYLSSNDAIVFSYDYTKRDTHYLSRVVL